MSHLLMVGPAYAALVAGALLLTRTLSRAAASAGIPPFVVGITAVAVGSSTPELAVAIQVSLSQRPDILVSTLAGSTLFNVWLLLGAIAVAAPLSIESRAIRGDVYVLVITTMFVLWSSFDGAYGAAEGLVLLTGGVSYAAIKVRRSRHVQDVGPFGQHHGTTARMVLTGIAAVFLLFAGSSLFVRQLPTASAAATDIVLRIVQDDISLGLVVVAVVTSVPEAIVCGLAALKGERQLAAGGILGSTTFNLLVVLGAGIAVSPDPIRVAPTLINLELPLMLIAGVTLFSLIFTGQREARVTGVVLVTCYLIWLWYVTLFDAGQSRATRYAEVVGWIVVPAITLRALYLALRGAIGEMLRRNITLAQR